MSASSEVSTKCTVSVPAGMSYVNAWRALWLNAEDIPLWTPELEELVSTSEKVAKLFQDYPSNRSCLYYMEYEGGRKMKVHFCDFPKLDVYYYDIFHGSGAAQKALDAYNSTPSKERFDKNDSYLFSDLRKFRKDRE